MRTSLGCRGGVLETPRVSTEQVALIPQCAEREAVWLPADEERWRAASQTTSRPAAFYCPDCAEREFSRD